MKLLLFDIDGTLLFPGDASQKALDAAFEEIFGVKDSAQGISTLGRTDPGTTDLDPPKPDQRHSLEIAVNGAANHYRQMPLPKPMSLEIVADSTRSQK